MQKSYLLDSIFDRVLEDKKKENAQKVELLEDNVEDENEIEKEDDKIEEDDIELNCKSFDEEEIDVETEHEEMLPSTIPQPEPISDVQIILEGAEITVGLIEKPPSRISVLCKYLCGR
jgi:hypothetical protein